MAKSSDDLLKEIEDKIAKGGGRDVLELLRDAVALTGGAAKPAPPAKGKPKK